MAVLCGWASIDENGKSHGGKAGDQTGREVKTGAWYNFGQTEVFRWKDREKAALFSSIIKYWCNDPDIGYDQYQRTTLGKWCKEHGYSYKVTTKVETDCSRMIADAINCVMKKEVFKIDETFYTGNLGEKLMATGLFKKYTASKYVHDDDYLMAGDIINNPAKHVITALGNGSKVVSNASSAKKSIAAIAQEVIDGKWGSGSTRKSRLEKAGYNYTTVQKKVNEILNAKKPYGGSFPVLPAKGYLKLGDEGTQVKRLQLLLNWYGNYGLAVDGSFGSATKTALKAFQRSTGLVADGFFGPASLAKAKTVRK